jgi:hypothetical protein
MAVTATFSTDAAAARTGVISCARPLFIVAGDAR